MARRKPASSPKGRSTERRRRTGLNAELFVEPGGQLRLADKSAEQVAVEDSRVECLGHEFESEAARREHFLVQLRGKLTETAFRKTEGFPIAADEDILRLSDPPYFTACPNPFLEQIVRHHGRPIDPKESYQREPFAVDVSVGKTDLLYKVHAYHTKVPHLAIVPLVLHYTRPGDLILDGFAGSGMTGVAAQWCSLAPKAYRQTLERQFAAEGRPKPEWGQRHVILNDLAPAATFIAAGYNLPFDLGDFTAAVSRILLELQDDVGWMYETLHNDGRSTGRINFTVWTEVFACPHCSGEVDFIEATLDRRTKRTRRKFLCPNCGTSLTKDKLQRLFNTVTDSVTGRPRQQMRIRPALINYSIRGSRFEKVPDGKDLERLTRIAKLPLPPEVPIEEFRFDDMWEAPRLQGRGISHLHHLFLPRQAHALASLWRKALRTSDSSVRRALLFFAEQAIWGLSLLARYVPTHYSQTNQYVSGALYIGSQIAEVSPWYILTGKSRQLVRAFRSFRALPQATSITTGDCGRLPIPDNSIDYIFTDPPFGDNFPYAELNLVVESWHRVRTDSRFDAIVDRAKRNKAAQKGLVDYQRLISRCFEEYFRVLKAGRCITVVFSNSRTSVWRAIQEALGMAGFVISDVRTLDKRQRTLKQLTGQAVRQDLVISAYKPTENLSRVFGLHQGSEQGVFAFVGEHLRKLPVFVGKLAEAEVVAERTAQMLHDRMIAFHVQRGVAIPIVGAGFFAKLAQRFPERDGMYFLPDQVAEYDRRRLAVSGIRQLELFVSDESSAIQWIRQELSNKPYTLQELTPKYMQEAQRAWSRHEKPLELRELLTQNFLRFADGGPIPEPIWAWMQKSAALRTLMREGTPENPDRRLRAEATDRWYVPDPNRAVDLEKLRERDLLKEFEAYRQSPQKTLKTFRLEAIRAGFRTAWASRDYATILAVADRLPEEVLQEDSQLLMWYDQALARSGRE